MLRRHYKKTTCINHRLYFLREPFKQHRLCGEKTIKNPDKEHQEYYEYLLKVTEGQEQYKSYIMGDGDIEVDTLNISEVELFRNQKGIITFDYDLSGIKSEYITDYPFDLYAYFVIYTSINTYYTCRISILNNPVLIIEDVIKAAGVENPAEITAVRVYEDIDVPAIKEEHYEDFAAIRCMHHITGINITKPVKSTTINGIRYKFSADGTCEGKYTGWTKSEKGRRYYKDGVLLKERFLKTKSGKRYYADDNGYVTLAVPKTSSSSTETSESKAPSTEQTPENDGNPGSYGSFDIRYNDTDYYFFLDQCEFIRDKEGKCFLVLADPWEFTAEGFEFSEEMFLYDETINDILNSYEPAGTAEYVEGELKNDFETDFNIFDNGDVYYFPDKYAGYYIYVLSDKPTYVVDGMEIYTYGFADKHVY